ncbi:FAD/FMN-containing dehydrogenase [Rhodobium orientis]|uniref:Hydroxyacid dehydrogenase n=1 Tax=Rhodobium orientis TaxID=34017 RepID=A0A327JDG8_9HYPH|nr:FAD-binding oxidoreductase [Rhodobium orientis]MBB4303919.1 FAD/FMN-containing dehydrogenase [Rhodobium orientis]MBK5951464.1 hydroxyacid dehydrogenase [Rhodobium orientis]RAI24537.1 hydroxyacid dehydrogenase [Rhodobium orientis]
MTETAIDSDTLDALAAIVGPGNALTADEDTHPYCIEMRDLFVGRTPLVLRPGSAEEISKILRLANERGIAIVPQGGNTGLVGAQVPDESGAEIILATDRLDAIRSVDPVENTMTVEAGVILENIHAAADEVDRLFPLTLAAQGSCRIGGNISTNAGGTAVLAYGNTRALILGLEVVLPTGEIWNGLRSLHKDNTGYDLKQLFIGGEGTLGVVTAAVLKLFPKPRSQEVALAGLADPAKALELLNVAQAHAGPLLTGFELMPRLGIEFVLKHLPGARDPLEGPHPWYVLVEISSNSDDIPARQLLESMFEEAFEKEIATDAVVAESVAQAEALWQIRHSLSEVQKSEGGSIKHDVSVPVSKIPAFLDKGMAAAADLIPGIRPVPFGHMGDGNIHFNFSQPEGADKADYLARWDELNAVIHGIVAEFGGSISAEHGIGKLKKKLLPDVKSEIELDLMRRIKAAFDPNNILNPGRVL